MPNIHKAADAITDSCVITLGVEIGAGWTRKGETSSKVYVSLSTVSSEFEPNRLYAERDGVAGSKDEDLCAVIWNPGD